MNLFYFFMGFMFCQIVTSFPSLFFFENGVHICWLGFSKPTSSKLIYLTPLSSSTWIWKIKLACSFHAHVSYLKIILKSTFLKCKYLPIFHDIVHLRTWTWKRIVLKYGKNHDENLLELYGNIKEPYPWSQGHYIHICNKKIVFWYKMFNVTKYLL
jgi:hypothetical protein